MWAEKMKNPIRNVVKKFKEHFIGNLVVKHERKSKPKGIGVYNDSQKDNFSILTKKDFLLYVLRNYKPHIPEKSYLNIKIKEINPCIILKEEIVLKIKDTILLSEAIQILKKKSISLLPVIDEQNHYKGFINKSMIFYIFKHELYKFMEKPVSEFMEYVRENNVFSDIFLDSLKFTPEDSFLTVLKKFVFNYAQLLWIDEENKLKGVISLHDIFNVFLE